MTGLRALAEADLAATLEGEFGEGMPIVLVAPDGTRQETSANDPLGLADLVGQVLFDTVAQDADGNQIIDHKPVVTLRRSSLSRVPVPSETWAVEIPTSPRAGATRETYILERPSQHGASLGLIRLYLRRAEQST